MRVKVYFNLHNKLWSIKDVATGQVIGHAKGVEVQNCKFQVSEAGRLRVLREGRKNVHAFVVGDLWAVEGFKPYKDRGVWIAGNAYSILSEPFMSLTPVSYNPRVSPYFHLSGSPEIRYQTAAAVYLMPERVREHGYAKVLAYQPDI